MLGRQSVLVGICLMPLAVPAVAQEGLRVPIDRIVAVVGETPIAMSRVDEQLQVFISQGGKLPDDTDSLRQIKLNVLNQIIDDELVIQAAEKDTLVEITEEEVQGAVEEAMGKLRDQVASRMDFERQVQSIGFKSLDDYRVWLSEQQRRQILRSTYMEQLRQRGVLVPVPPTEAELRNYYETARDRLPKRPVTVSFRQIAVPSVWDPVALAKAEMRADSLVVRLRGGEDFAELARQFSADSVSAERGGELGWVRRGQGLVKEFEDLAFRLRPGKVSNPLLTPFGFHIIEVERAEPASIQVRHILIAPEITEAQVDAARKRAQEVKEALERGLSFDSLSRVYHDRTENRFFEDVPFDGLPPYYKNALANAKPNEVIGPLEVDRGLGRILFPVVIFQKRRDAGTASFEDLKDRMRSSLAESNALKRFIKTLRESTYVDIRL
ncbi:MAG: peptidylprolyl isomerase [Gemmatimonadales bacterium]